MAQITKSSETPNAIVFVEDIPEYRIFPEAYK
jgi:hypothetical protein